ncbi:MAG: hypothetical protein KKA05_02365, partial [Alphaproteobacteria bacterium]|nr:hypothetical protein [Alphaproteobacteria bacterium]
GYVAEFAKYDFYTPLTCDQSEACTTLRMVGIDPGLDNAAPDIPAAEKTARIQATTEKCITVGQFMPERRAELCACTNALLVGQDPRVTRLSPAAAECLEDRGGLDYDHCVIGEADWNAASRAAFICSAGG